MEYEAAVEAVSKLANGSDILGALTEKVHKTNSEAKNLRERAKKLESALRDADFDPEGNFAEQLTARLSKTKPAEEFDALNKKIEKLSGELATWKQTAQAASEEAILSKAREQFSGPIKDVFGKSADTVLELLSLKKVIAVKDGVTGAMIDGDFVPLSVQKGPGALDKIKTLYPHLAITKQTKGGSDVNANPRQAEPNNQAVDRATFETYSGDKKLQYMKEVGAFAE